MRVSHWALLISSLLLPGACSDASSSEPPAEPGGDGGAGEPNNAEAGASGSSGSETAGDGSGEAGAGAPPTAGRAAAGNPGNAGAGPTGGRAGANSSGAGQAGANSSGAGQAGTDSAGANAGGPTDAPMDCGAASATGNPGRICIRGKNYYLNGINVAWDQWTADLTNYDAGKFETMFSTLEASGANSIRWWWFIDGENQLRFNGNLAQPLSQNIFDNLDTAFDAAAAHGVLIMPVLLSFDIQSQGREFFVTNEAATDAFVTNVVKPLVARYSDHPGMGLWEIMNEGDWLLSEEGGSVSIADYQRFHGKVAAGIHEADTDALVTTGSASLKYLASGNNILSDAALMAAAGGDTLAYLDVYQIHYYAWMHGDGWTYEPWVKSSSEWSDAGKPILVGEFPCKGEPGRWSALDMHVESVNQGYAGTFCWAYFDNRADDEGTWADARPGAEAIAAQIPEAMAGE